LKGFKKNMAQTPLFDVVSVRLFSRKVGLIAQKKSQGEAQVIIGRMIARRGLDDEFFAVVPTDSYRDNDPWKGPDGGGA
jgi:hypothetical protein